MTDVEPNDFFRKALDLDPDSEIFDYQRRMLDAEHPFEVLAVPTGCGKTAALLVSWLYSRLERDQGPRRLIYALPMRSLVEQTYAVASEIRNNLGLDPKQLEVTMLLGGSPNRSWTSFPERNHIIVGTIDMLLSRAMNRGYAEGRFMWPVSFGLLNNDCRWVFDEIQLMGPALPTSLQLDGLRRKLGTTIPCETTWASATLDPELLASVDRSRPEPSRILELPESDRTERLAQRLNAPKKLERMPVSSKESDRAKEVAAFAAAEHQSGTRTLVVLNRVARARAVSEALRRILGSEGARLVTVHSRFRPPDRNVQMEQALDDSQLHRPDDPGTIVIATQVVEAGIDTSSSLLITDLAPFSSVVQRIGRCNRFGELGAARVIWLDPQVADSKLDALAAPYTSSALAHARATLTGLEGESASPSRLSTIGSPSNQVVHPTLRRIDLLDLFDTAPDISGNDVDVGRFIREDDDRDVPVFFRDLDDPEFAFELEAPTRDELVNVPIGELRKLLSGDKARHAWVFDHVDGRWVRGRGNDLVPAQPVLLLASDGGYDELGWNGKSKSPVPSLDHGRAPPAARELAERISDDRGTHEAPGFVTLADHLAAVLDEARALTSSLPELDQATDVRVVELAAGLHDIGKAHPVFQEALRSVARDRGEEAAAQLLLAKSPGKGKGYARSYFRHELPGALALHAEAIEEIGDHRAVVCYLIAAHHGRVRMSIRPAPGERPSPGRRQSPASHQKLIALGVVEDDQCEPVETPFGHYEFSPISLQPMVLGATESWSAMSTALRDDPELGPFRLGFLEALVRISDWRGSAAA